MNRKFNIDNDSVVKIVCGNDQDSRQRCVKVAHLHSTLGVYGAERWTYTLLKHLNSDVVASIGISVGLKEGADEFYKFLRSEQYAAFHLPISGKINRRIIQALRRVLLDQEIDVLHTHGFKADVIGYFAVRKMPVSLVSTLHGWSQDEGFRIKMYEYASRRFLKHFDCIYPLSPALENNLQELGFEANKIRMILNAVDLSGVTFNPYVYSNEVYRIIFIGRLCRQKGVYELVEAFSRVRFVGSAKLTIVGDGPEHSDLRAFSESLNIAEKIEFTGAVDNVAPFLEKCHALVLPSYSEGIPRVVMEAFAAGVPVIATDLPGIRQLVTDKINGSLVPVKDVPALVNAMEHMQSHPDIARQYSEKARAIVVEKFSAQRMANDFQREYARLFKQSRRP
jgi:glycosyltransferase involved in cell wall biosynthesis